MGNRIAQIDADVNPYSKKNARSFADVTNEAMLEQAIFRAKAFEQAGANGFFAPGLADEKLIGKLCEATPLPVNIIALPHVPDKATLSSLNVARISYGPVPYRRMAQWLEAEARQALD